MSQSDRITTWTEAARVLGIDRTTLQRHRATSGDRRSIAWFRNADAVIAWWERLHALNEASANV